MAKVLKGSLAKQDDPIDFRYSPDNRSGRASGAALRQLMAGPCAVFMEPVAAGRRASGMEITSTGFTRTRL